MGKNGNAIYIADAFVSLVSLVRTYRYSATVLVATATTLPLSLSFCTFHHLLVANVEMNFFVRAYVFDYLPIRFQDVVCKSLSLPESFLTVYPIQNKKGFFFLFKFPFIALATSSEIKEKKTKDKKKGVQPLNHKTSP